MDEVYAGALPLRGRALAGASQAPALCTLAALAAAWRATPPACVAGSALAAFGERLPSGDALRIAAPHDRAAALARLARAGVAARRGASTPRSRCRCTCATRWR